MREGLSRGKRVDNGEWVEGYLILKGNQAFIASFPYFTGKVHETNWLEFCFGGFIEVIPETVGQYIGLPDKNGKKIFEGDIVTILLSGKPAKGVVEYLKTDICGFAAMSRSVYSNYVLQKNCAYKVIGNIHDNPELLEVEE